MREAGMLRMPDGLSVGLVAKRSEHKPAAKKADSLAADDCAINEDVSFDQVVAADAVAGPLAQHKAVGVTA